MERPRNVVELEEAGGKEELGSQQKPEYAAIPLQWRDDLPHSKPSLGYRQSLFHPHTQSPLQASSPLLSLRVFSLFCHLGSSVPIFRTLES